MPLVAANFEQIFHKIKHLSQKNDSLSEEILGFSGEKSMECDTGCKLWWSVEQAGGRTLPLIVQSILHHPPP